MDKFKESIDKTTARLKEASALKAFRVKLAMERIKATTQISSFEALKCDSMGYFTCEFDINGLPLPVKKHIITAGIIQGDIFRYGDGFAEIKEITSSETLHLQIQALNLKSYGMAVGVVETLIDEALDIQKKTPKITINVYFRSWDRLRKKIFRIQHLSKPVISHIITKGIIRGEIFRASGAVVNTRGSPYLTSEVPKQLCLKQMPLCLLIQAPKDEAVYWAEGILEKLIKEAKEVFKYDIPQVVPEKTIQPSKEPGLQPPRQVTTADVQLLDQPPQPPLNPDPEKQLPPFMPELGQNVDADIKRCVALVQWLLAHPLLVSFMLCPPKGLNLNKFSRKMVLIALLSLPLYDQYECTHMSTNQTCFNCCTFFTQAQKAVHDCCDEVLISGYNICNLISVDGYIKKLSDDSAQIGVLYDYPLPLNLYYLDNCRLFIDLVTNYGFESKESDILSYLKSTELWYPLKAYKKIVNVDRSDPYFPSKNPKRHKYPLYCSLDHQGGLAHFQLVTIANALPGQVYLPDSPTIPKCKYFPFLNRLSVFGKPEMKSERSSTAKVSIPEVAYELAQAALKNSELNKSLTSFGEPSTQQPPVSMKSGFPVPPTQTPDLFAMPMTSISQPILHNLESALNNMQMTMPVMQPNLFGAQLPILMGQNTTPNSILKPPLLNQLQFQVQQQKQDVSHLSSDSLEQNPFSDVISKLQEYIQATSTETAESTESGDTSTASVNDRTIATPQSSSEPSEDSPFSAIIQQLQQYIGSNDQNKFQDIKKIESSTVEQFKKPNVTIKSESVTEKQQTSDITGHKQDSSKLKRTSTESAFESIQPKRVCVEYPFTKPTVLATTNPMSVGNPGSKYIQLKPLDNPGTSSMLPKTMASQNKPWWDKVPSSSVDNRSTMYKDVFSSISILSDSLLKEARKQFGGSDDLDFRNDMFTITRLQEEVVKFHLKGGRLHPFCLVMCGVNDIIDSVTPEDFNKQLRLMLNYLLSKGYYVLLVTFPLEISSVTALNSSVLKINGMIMSYNTKANVSVISLHKLLNTKKGFPYKSMHTPSNNFNGVVLSEIACKLIRNVIETDVPHLKFVRE